MTASVRPEVQRSTRPSPRTLAAAGGLGFAICMVAGAMLSAETLAYLPPADDIAARYAGNTPGMLIATYILCFGALFLAAHAVGIGGLLRPEGDRPDTLAGLALAGGMIAATLVLVAASATFAGVERAAATGIPVGAAVALSDFNGVVLGKAMPMGFALLVGATALAVWRRRILPGWARWASAALAVGLVSPFMWAFVVFVVAWAPMVGFLLGRSVGETQTADRSQVTSGPAVEPAG